MYKIRLNWPLAMPFCLFSCSKQF